MMFNGPMIGAVVLAWLISQSVIKIEEAYYHEGPIIVEPEDGSRRWMQSEADHKKGEYLMGGFMLTLGICLWYYLAKDLHDSKATKD
jgi:hypothetical protein